jgi:hypothetical protein
MLLHGCLTKDLETQLESIQSHKEYVAGLMDGDPLSSKAIDHANKLWFRVRRSRSWTTSPPRGAWERRHRRDAAGAA